MEGVFLSRDLGGVGRRGRHRGRMMRVVKGCPSWWLWA